MVLPESRQLDFDEIPVIDISRLLDKTGDAEVIRDIDRACRDIGFFYIVGHGFDMRLASHLLTAASEFFSLPETARLDLGLDPSMRGYLPLYYRSKISDSFSGTSHQEGFWIGRDFGTDSRHPLEQSNRYGTDRYSIPYFVNPSADVVISALDGSDSFSSFNYGNYQAGKWRNFFPVDDSEHF